jgi:hypothetical protein
MQNDDIDQIEKTISEYREASFDAMLNKHYTHAAFDSTLLPALSERWQMSFEFK